MPNPQPGGPGLFTYVPKGRVAWLYPQAQGVHLIAFYDPHELVVGLF